MAFRELNDKAFSCSGTLIAQTWHKDLKEMNFFLLGDTTLGMSPPEEGRSVLLDGLSSLPGQETASSDQVQKISGKLIQGKD